MGGTSGVLPLPKSMPLPAPVSVFALLLPAVPLSRTRSLVLSTPLPCAQTETALNKIIKARLANFIMGNTVCELVPRCQDCKGRSQNENRLTTHEIQGRRSFEKSDRRSYCAAAASLCCSQFRSAL